MRFVEINESQLLVVYHWDASELAHHRSKCLPERRFAQGYILHTQTREFSLYSLGNGYQGCFLVVSYHLGDICHQILYGLVRISQFATECVREAPIGQLDFLKPFGLAHKLESVFVVCVVPIAFSEHAHAVHEHLLPLYVGVCRMLDSATFDNSTIDIHDIEGIYVKLGIYMLYNHAHRVQSLAVLIAVRDIEDTLILNE